MDPVFKNHFYPAHDGHGRFDFEQVLITGRLVVFGLNVHHRKLPTVFLKVTVGESSVSEVSHSAAFKIFEVIRVVNDAHLVGIAEDDAVAMLHETLQPRL